MSVPILLLVPAYLLVAMMFVFGVLTFTNRDLANSLTGHTDAGAPQVLGGRSVFIGVLGLSFLMLGEYRAMAILLLAGAALAVFDAFIERRHGGPVAPHIGTAIIAAILGYFFYAFGFAPMGGA